MGALLADEPLPIIEGIGLVAMSASLILASFMRIQSRGSGSRVVQLFWHDLS